MKKRKRKPLNTDAQLKYSLVGRSIKLLLNQLEKAGAIGLYKLGQTTTVDTHDAYYDTANLLLSKAGILLTSSLVNGNQFLLRLQAADTLSSEAIHTSVDIQGRPNPTVLRGICNHLISKGIIEQSFSDAEFLKGGFEGLFQSWGFKEVCFGDKRKLSIPVFDRHSRRIASLYIDKLVFHNPRRRSKEVFEISIKAEKGDKYILPDLSALVQQYFQNLIGPSSPSEYQHALTFIRVEEDLRLETKLMIGYDELQRIEHELQGAPHIGDFKLGTPNKLKIKDWYYDTPDFTLRENGSYLRLRELGRGRVREPGRDREQLLTFRAYRNSDDNQILNAIEVKDLANRSTLLKIANHLVKTQILTVKESSILELPEDLLKGIAKLGFQDIMTTRIKRLVFPVMYRGEYFANIKVDDVSFEAGSKTELYAEVEVAAQNAGHLIKMKALAYNLMSKFEEFGMELISQPKYIVGLSLIQTGKPPQEKTKKSAHVYTREDGTGWIDELDRQVTEENGSRAASIIPSNIFIGHGRSPIWARLQIFLENELKLKTVSYESESRVGRTIVPILEEMLNLASFAVLILTAEDETAVGTKRTRQNVVHEVGLFQGRLGFERAILLIEEGLEEFTNVAGLQYILFNKDNFEQAFYELRKVLERERLLD